MDYAKLNKDFDEASRATTENIMDILHDIVCSPGSSDTYRLRH